MTIPAASTISRGINMDQVPFFSQYSQSSGIEFNSTQKRPIAREFMTMSAPSSALDQSAFFVPFIDSHRLSQCKKTYEMMVERGMESWTMAGRAVSWAEDQDPLGHVKASAYLPYITNCVIRLMESFQGQLGDKYPDFISGKGKGFLSNKSELKINRVAKYPDMVKFSCQIPKLNSF